MQRETNKMERYKQRKKRERKGEQLTRKKGGNMGENKQTIRALN